MADTFLLGAGFSKAINSLNMPLADELGRLAIERLVAIHGFPLRTHADTCDGMSCDNPSLVDGKPPGQSFEMWLSQLAEALPFRLDFENATALSTYLQLADAVADEIRDATRRACQQAPGTEPPWLEPLLRTWHRRRAEVITFNYDTLIEARFEALGEVEPQGLSHTYGHRDLAALLLPPAGKHDEGHTGPMPGTFRLMKLHGSVSWYWDPVTRSAESMVDVGLPAQWPHDPNNRTWDPNRAMPGRRPVIVPPTASKTRFFDNHRIRELWRRAFEAIRSADRLVIIGYSMPVYDLMVTALLQEAVRTRRDLPAAVVDVTPAVVKERLETLGFTSVRAFDDVGQFVSDYI